MVAGGISHAAEVRAQRRAGIERLVDGFGEISGNTPELEALREAGLDAAAHPRSREAGTRFDQATRAWLDANSGHAGVDAYLEHLNQSRLPASTGEVAGEAGDTIVVTADRDYLLGPTIDRAGIWVGEVRHEIGQAVGQYIEDNPGVGIALQLADAGLAIAGPARYLGGMVLSHFEEQAAGFIADQMDGPRMWARDMAENGGHGFVFAGVVILGGLGGLRRGVGNVPSTVPRVNGRYPINARYAGQTHPSGIQFTAQGFPDFSPHAVARARLDNLTGRYASDAALANQAVGLARTPRGYVWHHVEDGATMQLIPRSVHNSVRHTGGAAVIRNGGFD